MSDNDQKTDNSAKQGGLKVKVYSPFKVYFDGMADSITAVNDTGLFDVLVGHHSFLTLLNPCDLIIRQKDVDDETITITRGLMHVRKDKIDVFLDV
jgi:F0F1-type ATP synthase epsilon subunit